MGCGNVEVNNILVSNRVLDLFTRNVIFFYRGGGGGGGGAYLKIAKASFLLNNTCSKSELFLYCTCREMSAKNQHHPKWTKEHLSAAIEEVKMVPKRGRLPRSMASRGEHLVTSYRGGERWRNSREQSFKKKRRMKLLHF